MDDDSEFNDDSDDSFMMNENDDNVETDGITSISDDDAGIGDESSDDHSEGFESNEGGVPYVGDIVGPRRWTREAGEKFVLEKDNVFIDITKFRNVLRDYAIQEGFELYRQKNEKTRVTAICAAGNCPWRIHASLGKDKSSFIIKSLNPKHTCLRTGNKCDATFGWIARQLMDELSADFKMGYDLMYKQLNSKFGINHSCSRLYRAKKKVKNKIEGTHEDAYSILPAYAELIRMHNPGSIFKIQYYEGSETMAPRFKRSFLCLDACKTGFIKGCRPFLGLDGCHFKGQFGGVLLAAIGVDGNGGQFPLACAVVEKENNSSWHWFLERLKEVLGSNYEGFAFPFMSDRQKGLSQMVVELFPMAQHMNCCVHLAKNFKAKFPQVILSVDLWDATRAYTKHEFNIAMRKLASHNEDASSWLSRIPIHQWARHTFNTICKVDHMTNNNAGSFNSWIGKLRGKPIIQLFERLRMKLMSSFHERYQRGCSWHDQVCENVRKGLDKIVFEAQHCKCSLAGKGEFQVMDGNKNFMVNLESRSCNCLIWEYSGLPCKHAVVCIIYIRANIEDYVNEYFFKEKYLVAYEKIIHPQPDISTSEVSHKVYLPFLARLPGRPRVNRRLDANESGCGSSTESIVHFDAQIVISLVIILERVNVHR